MQQDLYKVEKSNRTTYDPSDGSPDEKGGFTITISSSVPKSKIKEFIAKLKELLLHVSYEEMSNISLIVSERTIEVFENQKKRDDNYSDTYVEIIGYFKGWAPVGGVGVIFTALEPIIQNALSSID